MTKRQLPKRFFPFAAVADFAIVMPRQSDKTVTFAIPTPRGWRCRRKNCRSRIKHSHGVWATFLR